MFRITALVWLLPLSLLTHPLCGQEPYAQPDKIDNAALVYWQAFAVLPEFSDEEAALLSRREQGEPLPAEASVLLKKSESALQVIRPLGPNTPCRWEIIVDGPATLLPHLSKARQLARLLILEARSKAESDPPAAIAPLTAALLLGRNVDEGVLIQLLVGEAIEGQVLDVAEPLLEKLDPVSAAQLGKSFGKLPPRAQMDEAIRYEREVFGEWLEPIFTGDPAAALLKLRAMGTGNDLGEMVRLTAMLSQSKEERQKAFDQFLAQYDKMAAACRLPREESAQALKKIEEEIKASPNTLISMLMPALGKAEERHWQTVERYTRFQDSLEKAAADDR